MTKLERKHIGTFHIDDLTYWVITSIENVEKFKNLNGEQKKDKVIEMILNEIEDDSINTFAKIVIPQMIDALIEVDGNGLSINQDVKHDVKIMARGFIDTIKDIFSYCGCLSR